MMRRQSLKLNSFKAICAAGLALCCGCVDLPKTETPQEPERQAVRLAPNFDLGLQRQETLHFLVKSYSLDAAAKYADTAEKLYQQLMQATGLYSFMPRQPYELVVLPDRQDYLSKTGAPEWSGGVTIGNAIVAYDSPQAPSVIAHEMSHLIFNEFMETARPELTWLNEGLAVCMERKSYSAEQQLAYENTCASALQYGAVPLQTLMISSPAKQERQGAQAWYCQANSVVSYLLDKGGGIGFSVLANKLKSGSSFNDAVFIAYNGQWPDLPTFERGWLATSGARPNGGPAIN